MSNNYSGYNYGNYQPNYGQPNYGYNNNPYLANPYQEAQQKLQQLEQQRQTLYQPAQQPVNQQMPPLTAPANTQQAAILGIQVASEQEARMYPIDLMNGNVYLFRDVSNGKIYLRQFDVSTGKDGFAEYVRVEPEQPTEVIESKQPVPVQNNDVLEELKAHLDAMNQEIKELKGEMKNVSTDGKHDGAGKPPSAADDTASTANATTGDKPKSNNRKPATTESK